MTVYILLLVYILGERRDVKANFAPSKEKMILAARPTMAFGRQMLKSVLSNFLNGILSNSFKGKTLSNKKNAKG